MTKRILIVEDDLTLARVLRDNLAMEGFQVESVADGDRALSAAAEFVPDLILLDIALPGKDGFELTATWSRASLSRIPIVMLTARGQKSDKLRGLALGADDYITKPFDLEELIARIHAILRRVRPSIDRVAIGTVTVDFARLQAWDGGRVIELTHREFELLQYLAERSETIVHRDELLRHVWKYPEIPITRAVDHAIARLRRKIEPDAHHPKFIHSVYGDGYCLTLVPSATPLPGSDVRQ